MNRRDFVKAIPAAMLGISGASILGSGTSQCSTTMYRTGIKDLDDIIGGLRSGTITLFSGWDSRKITMTLAKTKTPLMSYNFRENAPLPDRGILVLNDARHRHAEALCRIKARLLGSKVAIVATNIVQDMREQGSTVGLYDVSDIAIGVCGWGQFRTDIVGGEQVLTEIDPAWSLNVQKNRFGPKGKLVNWIPADPKNRWEEYCKEQTFRDMEYAVQGGVNLS